ncbi:hypothetical protein [Paenibacillus sp. BC26]|nr:hypothetical protein [Paenibacillus sp. BC26]SFT27170.1 hypothetical protein SAMN05428962_6086 [Paenibacillus sp. BC26]
MTFFTRVGTTGKLLFIISGIALLIIFLFVSVAVGAKDISNQ